MIVRSEQGGARHCGGGATSACCWMRDARMYLFADSSGAVVIPGHQIDEVLDGPRKVAAADVSDREQMSNERAR
jgi:hypothetical protein